MWEVLSRYLSTPDTSCPVERLFSVGGQVDSSRRTNLSSDNLSSDNLTLLVFIHESLPLFRKIRTHRIVLLYHVLFPGTIKITFSVLGNIHDCMLYFLKKLRLKPQKLVFHTGKTLRLAQTDPQTYKFPKIGSYLGIFLFIINR